MEIEEKEEHQNEESSFLTSFNNNVGNSADSSKRALKSQKTIKKTIPGIKFSPEIDEIRAAFVEHKELCIK